jgi:hypothetical protein
VENDGGIENFGQFGLFCVNLPEAREIDELIASCFDPVGEILPGIFKDFPVDPGSRGGLQTVDHGPNFNLGDQKVNPAIKKMGMDSLPPEGRRAPFFFPVRQIGGGHGPGYPVTLGMMASDPEKIEPCC